MGGIHRCSPANASTSGASTSAQDETFFTDARRVASIATEFLDRRLPIRWAATMRADPCARLSEDDFALGRESGCRRAIVGVESGSPDTPRRMQKDIGLDQVHLAAERCRKHAVSAVFPFIVGFPLAHGRYGFPVEKAVARWLRSPHELS